MKKYSRIFVGLILGSVLIVNISCSDDNDNTIDLPEEEITDVEAGEGPSSLDQSIVPTSMAFFGDSIQQKQWFPLTENPIKKVTVSTTQNGHISVLGGYKEQAAVYIYAKADDNGTKLGEKEVAAILEKYYDVIVDVSESEIKASVNAKSNVIHEGDYRKLRVSMNIYTPGGVSTNLSIAAGSIYVAHANGAQHIASSTTGAIKYNNSTAKAFSMKSTAGYVAFINSSASESVDIKLTKGSVQFAVSPETKATLNLKSSTNISAPVLNSSNFSGENTRTSVIGKLNGGGYKINASQTYGSIVFKWYNN